MKILKSTLASVLLSVLLVGCNQESTTTGADPEADAGVATTLDTLDERFSYVMGMRIGTQMRMQNEELQSIDVDILVQALQDAFNEQELLLTDQEAQQVLTEFQQQMQAKADEASAANLKEGEEFLAANAEQEGVVVLDSGLQYKVVEAGSGEKPAATDRVTVHYRGRLIDGTEFDSSYSRNQPATFALNQVIPGWTEGVQLMAEGAKYEFYIPPDLAYGTNGSPPVIGPNSTLIFEVELIKANDKPGATGDTPEEAAN